MRHTRPTHHRNTFGFRVWPVSPHGAMPAAHTHPDVEFNFLREGDVAYLHGGKQHVVAAGRMGVFWGGVPHQTLSRSGNGIWLTLPLAWLLQWRLPGDLTQRLLAGDLIESEADLSQIERWLVDYTAGGERHRALQLELEAWLLRVALSLPAKVRRRAPDLRGATQIERIIGHIAAHYREAITVSDIAAAVKLHPKYLMRVFKQQCRIGVWEYLTRLRISHAQRLLVTTDARVSDIALDSGFGSSAAFYQAFTKHAGGEKPADYRIRHRIAIDA